jgi:probable HAF family extracellular repeat protein
VRYTVTEIGPLPNRQSSFLTVAGSINNSAVVAGYSFNGAFASSNEFFATAVGFIGEHDRLVPLPLLSGWPGAFAFGLNDHEQVFGAAGKFNSAGIFLQTPVFWDSGNPVNLGTLLPDSTAEAAGINNRGEVVGGSYSFDVNAETPFVWQKGQMKALPLLPGADGGEADGINDRGEITGLVYFGSIPAPIFNAGPPIPAELHSVLWTPEAGSYVVLDLGNFGGTYSAGQHISNRGEVVGGATDLAGNLHAYLWNEGGLHDLGLLPGGTISFAIGINDRGQIVGSADRADGNLVIFIWENGVMADLNDLVPVGTPLLTLPGGINERGDIAAAEFLPDGSIRSFVLTPMH